MSELWFAGQFAMAGIAFEIHEEAPELAHDPAKGRYYLLCSKCDSGVWKTKEEIDTDELEGSNCPSCATGILHKLKM